MIVSVEVYCGPARVEFDTGRGCGFDLSIGPHNFLKPTWFAIWFARRCDLGIAFGRKEWRHQLRGRGWPIAKPYAIALAIAAVVALAIGFCA